MTSLSPPTDHQLMNTCRMLSGFSWWALAADMSAVSRLVDFLTLGPRSDEFCRMFAAMTNELLAKSLPIRRGGDVSPLQFLSAALRPIKQSNIFPQFDDSEFFESCVIGRDSSGGDNCGARTVFSAALDDLELPTVQPDGSPTREAWVCRFLILDGLAREVTANRLMEYSRIKSIQAQTARPQLQADAGKDPASGRREVNLRKATSAVMDICKLITNAGSAAAASSGAGSNPNAAELRAALCAVASRVAPVKLQPVVDSKRLDPAAHQKMASLFELEVADYTLRRRALIARLEATLATFCEAKDAKLERQALRMLCDECIAELCPNPRLTISHVLQFPKIAVLGAFQKVSAAFCSRMGFPLRYVAIPKVPDRGGRVNTFGFDEKVAVAVSNANRDHAAKYSRGGGGRGGRGASSAGAAPATPAADAAQAAAPSKNAHVDPTAVRGRGGRWSGDARGGQRN